MRKKIIMLLCVCSLEFSLCGFTSAEQAEDKSDTGLLQTVQEQECMQDEWQNEESAQLTQENQFELRVISLLNENRAAAGLGELTLDADLMNSADIRACEIVISFTHTRPDGSRCFSAFPGKLSYFGENIAYGYATPEEVMNAWMNSEGHCKNIMNPNYTKVGIGCYRADNGLLYWVQCFGA